VVTAWGVRGSHPVPGPGTLVFGGNTSCYDVQIGADRFIVDAGTGIVGLGRSLTPVAGDRIHILLTHLHHDHVQGLPFFGCCFVPGVEVHLWCGHLKGECARVALDHMFASPLFPVTLDMLPARFVSHGFHAGETLEINGHRIATHPLNHPGGATAYRFEAGGGTLAIVTDIEHAEGGPAPGLIDYCGGADLVLYDSMFEEADYARFRGYGHSTPEAGIALARAAGVSRLIGIHHAPAYDDARLARLEVRVQQDFAGFSLVREGDRLVAGGPHAALDAEHGLITHAGERFARPGSEVIGVG
jgi:phosphoribosyl 1,2-cyclic phosphodiesterase